MAPFNIPAPCIVPLRLPVFGGPKSIDTSTRIQLLSETYLDHEIFYTLDGTKPQPYAGILQGSKVFKYSSPFCLPAGKITIKAIAINSNIHSICSSVVTKCFEVLKVDSETTEKKQSAKVKKAKKPKPKKTNDSFENNKNLNGTVDILDEGSPNKEIQRTNTDSVKEDESILDCFDEAFIGGTGFESDDSEIEDESIEEESSFPVNHATHNPTLEDGDDINLCDVGFSEIDDKDDPVDKAVRLFRDADMGGNNAEQNDTLTNDAAVSADTQFCCLKCDLTLQQCLLCNKMNGISSKFCIGCGRQLSRICSFCAEYNPSIATFCQCCGNKLNPNATEPEPFSKVDHSMMALPESKNAATQMIPVMIDKHTQTLNDPSPAKKSLNFKRLPRLSPHSPGRGYWHQQMDYICNHLKSHAYNNVEFRKEISEPVLCDFKSAHITNDENGITVTVVFSPLKDKSDPIVSEETKE